VSKMQHCLHSKEISQGENLAESSLLFMCRHSSFWHGWTKLKFQWHLKCIFQQNFNQWQEVNRDFCL